MVLKEGRVQQPAYAELLQDQSQEHSTAVHRLIEPFKQQMLREEKRRTLQSRTKSWLIEFNKAFLRPNTRALQQGQATAI